MTYTEHRIFTRNDPTTLRVFPELATEIGLKESMILLQLDYWINISTENKEPLVRDGKRWTYQSLSDMKEKAFPFWGTSTISRGLDNLEEQKLIESTDQYNSRRQDRTRWYTLNPAGFEKLESVKIDISQNGNCPEKHFPEREMVGGISQNGTTISQNGTTLPENTTEKKKEQPPEFPSDADSEFETLFGQSSEEGELPPSGMKERLLNGQPPSVQDLADATGLTAIENVDQAHIADPHTVDCSAALDIILPLWANHLDILPDFITEHHVSGWKELIKEYGPDAVAGASRLLSRDKSENPSYHWKNYSSPYQRSLRTDLVQCISQIATIKARKEERRKASQIPAGYSINLPPQWEHLREKYQPAQPN